MHTTNAIATSRPRITSKRSLSALRLRSAQVAEGSIAQTFNPLKNILIQLALLCSLFGIVSSNAFAGEPTYYYATDYNQPVQSSFSETRELACDRMVAYHSGSTLIDFYYDEEFDVYVCYIDSNNYYGWTYTHWIMSRECPEGDFDPETQSCYCSDPAEYWDSGHNLCKDRCPDPEQFWNLDTQQCESYEFYIQPEPKNPEQCGVGNPIDYRAENKFQIETDFSDTSPMPLRMTRYYNSTSSRAAVTTTGANWRHNYMIGIDNAYSERILTRTNTSQKSSIYNTPSDACASGWQEVNAGSFKGAYADTTAVYENNECKIQTNGNTLASISVKANNENTSRIFNEAVIEPNFKKITRPNGTIFTFIKSEESWQPTIARDIKLEQLPDNTWKFTDTNKTVEIFDAEGKLTSITNIAGHSQSLYYDETGKLDYVEDDNGNRLTFGYNDQDMVSVVTLPDNTQINYAYDTNDKLINVIYQDDTPENLDDNPYKQYLYENTTFPYSLTGIINEKGIRYSTFDYDSEGRATLTQHQQGIDKYEFVYNEDGSATITNPLGKETTYTFTAINGQVKVETVTGHPTQMCGGTNKNYTYDANGFIATKTDWNGNVTSYVRDEMGRILEKTVAVGTANAKTTAYQYHPTLKLKTQIDQYQGEGTATPIIKSTSIVYYGDAAGEEYWSGLIKSRTVTDPITGDSRTTSYTYYGEGELGARQLKTVDGPRTEVQDIITYTYDAKGNLKTTTNALGHISEINEYDGAGRPLTITDSNQVETVLTYTPRGWLSTSRTNGGDTQYIYDAVGNVTDIIAPDGSTITYTYDDANRLTDITDKHGNTIHYELNAMGGIVEQQIKDPNGTLTMIRSTVRDELNRIKHSIGANVEEDIETNYDDNGNVDNSVDAYQRVTDNSFDALNRITQTQDTAGGITTTRYDQYGNVNEVEDPRGLITKYNYNALGDLKELISPDTGITTYTHDSAGNIKTQTDANNITVTYSYDALNRLTDVTYPDTTENIHYGYDEYDNWDNVNFGRGKLTSITDQSGTTAYKYSSNGLVYKEIRTIAGTEYTFGYQYNLADKLTHITYPSGMIIEYIRDDAGKIVAVTATKDGQITTLADAIQYKPFGPQTNLQFGNGYIQTNSYNLNYQLESINTPNVLNLDYAYDYMGNITGMQDMLDSLFDQSYTLDNLYRLDTASSSDYGVIDYDLDATGNRIAITEDGQATNYTIDANSNRITNIGDITFGYDATGNTTSKTSPEANWIYAYNQNGRLKTVTKDGAQIATYIYNALGQRTRKTTEAGTTTQLYNSAAQLLVEQSATITKEYIYLGGQVLASYTTAEAPEPEPGPCPGTTATNNQHQTAGRAYSQSETTGETCWGTFCWGGTTTTTWYAQGSNENLGTSGTTSTTLYENGSDYWQTANPNNCVQMPTGPCESITSTNQEHVNNTRAYTTTEMINQTCWGTWCYGGTEQTVYKAQGSDDNLGTEATAQTTLFADPNGNYYLQDPETCPVELENPNYNGFAYYHNDHLGTPRVVTDANGNELWKAHYNPFGKVKETQNQDAYYEQNIRFSGQYHDRETNLYYNYFRYYQPEFGRYLTSDPIGLDGGINTYSYVSGNPLRYIDPTGEVALVDDAFIIGTAAVGLTAACSATNCIQNAVDSAERAVDAASDAFNDTARGIADDYMADVMHQAAQQLADAIGDSFYEAARGNQADTGITQRVNEIISDIKCRTGENPSKCEILQQLIDAGEISAKHAKATQKAWGCRRSRMSKNR